MMRHWGADGAASASAAQASSGSPLIIRYGRTG